MPIQPTVKKSGESVQYCEYLPDVTLQNVIFCYWELKTTKPLDTPFTYRVVADGCIDIYFEINNIQESYVMGFCNKYTEFELKNSFHYIGIRFLPTMFPQVFKIDASQLSNQYINLEIVSNETHAFLMNSLHAVSEFDIIRKKLDYFFKDLISRTAFNFDTRLYNAIHVILQQQGVLNIQKDLNVGISSRQLRRLFDLYIGTTPKSFSKVVRFQNILRAKPSSKSLKENKLFYDSGYYDQAHFIKEFKTFYGVTPTKAFGR
nr:helix-turn-helix domain-containing protein [Mariniflexile gromovii]